MKTTEKINPIGWLVLIWCFLIIYSLLILIFGGVNVGFRQLGRISIILGTTELIFFAIVFIMSILNREKELKQKTRIDRVCEKGF